MADERDDTERSEDPTQKRLDEALERGDVAKSQEVNTWFVIAALNDSYTLFRPGDIPLLGDVAALTTRTVATAFRIGIQLAAPFLVFGLLFNLGLGILSRLMPQMQVFFVGIPLSILGGLMLLVLAIGAMMTTFLGHVEGVMHELAPGSSPASGGGG